MVWSEILKELFGFEDLFEDDFVMNLLNLYFFKDKREIL